MSEVAGRMSVQAGGRCLERESGGMGILLGGVPGVPPARVAVLGGGVVGFNAAQMAVGLRADVTIYDINNDRLADLDTFFGAQIKTAYASKAAIAQAIQEAELVLEVVSRDERLGGPIQEDIGTGTYRLLFRVLASHPEEVRSFYEDTVAAAVRYDDQYRTDLVGTLEAYLEQNCNMNATAAAIYAHRNTVAYRLERVKELCGHDVSATEGREKLGLGLKAMRVLGIQPPGGPAKEGRGKADKPSRKRE